jgi:hypothetical protein
MQRNVERNQKPNGRAHIVPFNVWQWPMLGFFDAFRGLSRVQSDADTTTILHICAPAETALTHLARTFIEYAERNAQQLNDPAEIVALSALSKAFPCR